MFAASQINDQQISIESNFNKSAKKQGFENAGMSRQNGMLKFPTFGDCYTKTKRSLVAESLETVIQNEVGAREFSLQLKVCESGSFIEHENLRHSLKHTIRSRSASPRQSIPQEVAFDEEDLDNVR